MHTRFYRFVKFIFLTIDLLTINIIFYFGCFFLISDAFDSKAVPFIYFFTLLNVVWFFTALLLKVYDEINLFLFDAFGRTTTRSLSLFFTMLTLLFLLMKSNIPFYMLFLISGCVLVALMLNRLSYLLLIQYFNKNSLFQKRILIVGHNETAANIIRLLEGDFIGIRIVGFCVDDEKDAVMQKYPRLGKIESALSIAREYKVTDIFTTLLPEEDLRILPLMELADKSFIHFRIIPNLDYFIRYAYHFDFIGPIPVVAKRKEPLYELNNRFKKRLFDIGFSLFVILFIMTWLTPLVSLLILLETGWPVFFLQPRNGKANQIFSCVKFRSMKLNAQSHSLQATANDHRVTRLGKFLRKTSLDEFPQFFNVLLGSMSIVGPRPHMLQHTESFSQKVDQFMLRHFIKPGITGWAQINGYRGETETISSLEQRLAHDLWYLENWSLWLDLKIIFSTLVNMIKGDEKAF